MNKQKNIYSKLPMAILLSILIICITLGVTLPKLLMASFEIEGSCNSGSIGVDFQSNFVNNPYQEPASSTFINGTMLVKRWETNYDTKLLPKKFDIKGMDAVTCSYKAKGNIPIMALIDKWEEMERKQNIKN